MYVNQRKSKMRAVQMRIKSKLKSKKATILVLDDDCLLNVFRYVEIRDMAHIEQTCTRLRDLAKLYYRSMKTLKWTSDLPFASASKIICKFGCFTTSLHSLHFNGVHKPSDNATDNKTIAYQHFIDTLLDNCKNIKSLTFTGCIVSCEWAPFFDSLQHLESLSLFNTILRKSNYMRRVKTLKRFHLAGLHLFTPAKFNYFLFNNNRLSHLQLEDCEDLSKGLDYHRLSYLILENLTVEVYPQNVGEMSNVQDEREDDEELGQSFEHLKKLKITQAETNMNLNEFIETITKNAALDELDLFKVNVDQNTFVTLKSMKLKTLKLYPRFTDSASYFCRMLVESVCNLKHLTLVLFDSDRDTDISDDDLLLIIERLENLDSLDLHHCVCECDCDYMICPFRCKLRSLIDNINKIFEINELRPSLKLMLPKRMSQSFFFGKKKLQKKYRQVLTDRVQFVRSDELDDMTATSVYSKSFLNDFLNYLKSEHSESERSGSERSCSITSYDDSDLDDAESHPESDADMSSEDSWYTIESGDDSEESYDDST